MSEETPEENSSPDEAAAPELSLEERLSYLEEQNEGLKRVGMLLLGLCLLVGGLLIYTQYQSRQSLYSENIILGSSTTARSAFTPTASGHIGMLFYDAMGMLPPDPQLDAVANLDGLVLYDRLGRPRIVIGTNEEDEAIIDILNTEGKLVFTAGHGTNPGSLKAVKPPADAKEDKKGGNSASPQKDDKNPVQ